MWHKLIASALLSAGISATVVAQEKDNLAPPPPPRPKKSEEIIIRKKGTDSHERTTIVIDGDNITVNGKPFKDFKSANLELLLRKHDMAFASPEAWPIPDIRVFKNNKPIMPGNKAFLGVGSEKTEKGARIVSISKESPAEKAGLQKDDIITSVDDKKIDDSNDLYDAISKYNPGDKVHITYLRDGKENSLTAILDKNKWDLNLEDFHFNDNDFNFEMPEIPQFRNFNYNFIHKPRLGMEIQDVESGKGVTVLDVDDDTPASKAGLQKGDIITEVDGKAIDNVDDLKTHLKNIKNGDTVQLKYSRDGKVQSASIKFPKKLKTADL